METETALQANNTSLPDRSENLVTGQTSPSLDYRALEVRVEIDPELSPLLSSGDVLFVYARGAGTTRPVAAIRHEISKWPIDVILDDASSIMGTSRLFSFEAVEIDAHVSRSGEARAQTGDFAAKAVTIQTDANTVVQISISDVLP